MTRSLPVLGNVKRPVELEMGFVVIIGESNACLIVTTSQYAGWSLFFREPLHVFRGLFGAGREAANHLLVLADSNALALDGLDVLET